MKLNQILLLGALAAGAAFSGESDPGRMTIRTDFDFHAGATRLPAGEYDVYIYIPGVVRISNGVQNALVLVNMKPRGRDQQAAAVTFRRYGGVHFLSKVEAAGGGVYESVPGKTEQEVISRRGVAAARVVMAKR